MCEFLGVKHQDGEHRLALVASGLHPSNGLLVVCGLLHSMTFVLLHFACQSKIAKSAPRQIRTGASSSAVRAFQKDAVGCGVLIGGRGAYGGVWDSVSMGFAHGGVCICIHRCI